MLNIIQCDDPSNRIINALGSSATKIEYKFLAFSFLFNIEIKVSLHLLFKCKLK